MKSLPGKQVNCTRTLYVEMDECDDLSIEVPSTFQSAVLGPDGLLRILSSDGKIHMLNPEFVVRMELGAEVETDMDIKRDDES